MLVAIILIVIVLFCLIAFTRSGQAVVGCIFGFISEIDFPDFPDFPDSDD
jgi:hypothetical protein